MMFAKLIKTKYKLCHIQVFKYCLKSKNAPKKCVSMLSNLYLQNKIKC